VGDRSSIEWTDATWNPTRGCSRVSEGCRNCYAERIAARMSNPGMWGHGLATRTKAGPRWTGRVELVPSKLDQPLRWRRPRRIFVNSTSDLFHGMLSDLDINRVFARMARAPQHTYQVLTKRPERAREWFEWARVANALVKPWPLPNLWLGVSVEDQATADERIPLLLQTPAAVRWVSYEPALGPVDFRGYLAIYQHRGAPCCDTVDGWHPLAEGHRERVAGRILDWIVVGGESGPGARPFDLAWARSTVEQCKAAGVPVFVKQLGADPFDSAYDPDVELGPSIHTKSRKGGDMSEWPADLRVREMPGGAA
jgi:protein gp37